ncbi:MAG: BadF/BadG/BcrA/BcrD ATPase family protein [Candidatus Eisenbacteria bacterium]
MSRESLRTSLAIEAGGSTGKAALYHEGAISVRVIRSGLNPVDVGYSVFEERVRTLVIPLLDRLGAGGVRIYACAAVAGAGDPGVAAACRRILGGVIKSRSTRPRVRVLSDLDAMTEYFLSEHDGIVLIAGTGSVCAGAKHRRGRVMKARVGGRGGYLDRGSGFRMGLDVLGVALGAYDGTEAVNGTVRLLCERYGIELKDVPRRFLPPERDRIAGLARIALEAYTAGDPFARSLVREAARDLMEMVLAVKTKTGLGTRFRVVVSGGMFRDPALARLFRGRIRRTLPHAELHHVTDSLIPLLKLTRN